MEPLSRPAAPTSVADRARAWIEWFGVGRLVAASLATVVVCAGAVWLVRTPPPPTDASLAFASTTIASGAPPATATGSPIAEAGAPIATDTPTIVLVHVAGAVVEPGVYELFVGARVRDAIVAAGGPTPEADWDALNLAAVVPDASRVYVAMLGEDVEIAMFDSPQTEAASGPVDLNRATADALDELPGVGPATATAIITERERNGPFASVDDLDRVPGIGPAKLEALRDLVTT